jgi:Protein of unknown function (DUF2911)
MTISKLTLPVFFLVFLLACKEKPKEETPVSKIPLHDTLSNSQAETVINTYSTVDISPMDMSYFPVDYPKLKMTSDTVAPPIARVIYSRPHLQRRHFHDILKYDEPWRLGANESTEIDLYKSVTILGKKVMPGRYILYCIPHPETWTIVLNSNIDTWGLKQDSTRDVHRFDIPVIRNNPSLEYFTMVFERSATGADLVIGWDDVIGRLPIRF